MAGVPYDGADPQYADWCREYAQEFLAPEPNGQVGVYTRWKPEPEHFRPTS
jgi:hypothetical protein